MPTAYISNTSNGGFYLFLKILTMFIYICGKRYNGVLLKVTVGTIQKQQLHQRERVIRHYSQKSVQLVSRGVAVDHFLSPAPGTFSRWKQLPPSLCDSVVMEEDCLMIVGTVYLHTMGYLLGHLREAPKLVGEVLVSINAGQFLCHLLELSLPVKVFSVKIQNVLILSLGFLKFQLRLLNLTVKP